MCVSFWTRFQKSGPKLATETNQWLVDLSFSDTWVQLINNSNFEHLMEDISSGFNLFGQLRQGEYWEKRTWTGLRLSRSTGQCSFASTMSTSCTRSTLGRPDLHVSEMLKTALQEREEGRMSGPYQPPPHWEEEMVPLPPVNQRAMDVLTPPHRLWSLLKLQHLSLSRLSQKVVKVR